VSRPWSAQPPSPVAVVGLLGLLVASGCHHYQTHVPGVLDLRTDASGADQTKPRPPDRQLAPERSDLEALALGRGVIRQGRSLLLEERHYWVGGFIPLANTSAADEIEGLLANNPVLTDVRLEEQYSGTDVLLGLAAGFIMPPLSFFMPPYTFSFRGTPRRCPRASCGQPPGAAPPVTTPAQTTTSSSIAAPVEVGE
jgi:hypothetical protein